MFVSLDPHWIKTKVPGVWLTLTRLFANIKYPDIYPRRSEAVESCHSLLAVITYRPARGAFRHYHPTPAILANAQAAADWLRAENPARIVTRANPMGERKRAITMSGLRGWPPDESFPRSAAAHFSTREKLHVSLRIDIKKPGYEICERCRKTRIAISAREHWETLLHSVWPVVVCSARSHVHRVLNCDEVFYSFCSV